jgi:hypothetical protein
VTAATPRSVPRLLAVASAAIADVVTGPAREVRVLAAFPAAVYLAHDEGLVALVASDGIAHPNALVVAVPTSARPFAGTHPGQRGTVGGGRVELGGLTATVTRWFDPALRLPATSASALASHAEDLRGLLLERTGPFPLDLAVPAVEVAEVLRAGDPAAVVTAAHRLVGRGPGLTPAGDDVLAGLLAAVLALAPAVTALPVDPAPGAATGGAPGAAPGVASGVAALEALTATVTRAGDGIVERAHVATTAVSAELLRHAVRGEVAAPAGEVLRALAGRRPLRPALETLLAVGATSGRDLAHGLWLGADLVAATASSPPASRAAAAGTSTPPRPLTAGAVR